MRLQTSDVEGYVNKAFKNISTVVGKQNKWSEYKI